MTSAAAAYVAVGSNIEPARNIPKALALLHERTPLTAVSTFYWTRPIGATEQPAFANGMVCVETVLPPRDLKFGVLREVERELGRVRTMDKYAPRCIDLDLVLYGEVVTDEEGLCLPDPELRERPFLAAPLLELCPACRLPDTGALLAECSAAVPSADMTPDHAMTETIRKALLP